MSDRKPFEQIRFCDNPKCDNHQYGVIGDQRSIIRMIVSDNDEFIYKTIGCRLIKVPSGKIFRFCEVCVEVINLLNQIER